MTRMRFHVRQVAALGLALAATACGPSTSSSSPTVAPTAAAAPPATAAVAAKPSGLASAQPSASAATQPSASASASPQPGPSGLAQPSASATVPPLAQPSPALAGSPAPSSSPAASTAPGAPAIGAAPPPDLTAVSEGQVLITQKGCGGCHTIPGIAGANATSGPDLTGLANRTTLEGGTVPNTSPDDLKRWLLNPGSQSRHTSAQLTLSDDEAARIVAYLETLK